MKSRLFPTINPNTEKQKAKHAFAVAISNVKFITPHQFVCDMMAEYAKIDPPPDRSVHGGFFEYVIGEALVQKGVYPLYYQVEMRHVPLAKFDWLLYDPVAPTTISCKTKARDRWKQAAYEAQQIKNVYARAENYLVTIEPLGNNDNKKQEAIGTIDEFVIADKLEFDDFVDKMVDRQHLVAEELTPIISFGELFNPAKPN